MKSGNYKPKVLIKRMIVKTIPKNILHKYRMARNIEYRTAHTEKMKVEQIKKLPRFTAGEICLLGKRFYFIDNASFLFIYDEIFIKRIYSFTCSKPDPHIIDCGANIGLGIIFFKELFPDASILAFEPDPKVFDVLEKNVSSYSNVQLVKKALWDEETTLEFFSEGADAGSLNNIPDNTSVIKIQTERLRNNLNKPVDFLKIDIEGAELRVLKDCENQLHLVQNMFIEYHSFVGRKQELSSLITVLEQNNFRYHISSPGLSSSQPFIKLNTYNNMDMQLNIYAFRQ